MPKTSGKKLVRHVVFVVALAAGIGTLVAIQHNHDAEVEKLQAQIDGKESAIKDLKNYRENFPDEFAFAAHNPNTGWQVRLRCVNHMEPNTKYAVDAALVVWDRDFAGYRCNVIDEDPTGTTQ